jgi:hypothetical protein
MSQLRPLAPDRFPFVATPQRLPFVIPQRLPFIVIPQHLPFVVIPERSGGICFSHPALASPKKYSKKWRFSRQRESVRQHTTITTQFTTTYHHKNAKDSQKPQ